MAMISVNNSQGYIKLTDSTYNLDALILLNGIDATTSIQYIGNENIEWKYSIEGENYTNNPERISKENLENMLHIIQRIYQIQEALGIV